MLRDNSIAVAFAKHHGAKIGFADAGRVLQHRLEHWLQIAGRTGDDLEHLGGRSLLLQRLVTFASGLVELLAQVSI